jgi:hypothetical protein
MIVAELTRDVPRSFADHLYEVRQRQAEILVAVVRLTG